MAVLVSMWQTHVVLAQVRRETSEAVERLRKEVAAAEERTARELTLARQVHEAVQGTGLTVLEGFHYRYHPQFSRLAELASGRGIGALAVALNVAPGGAYKLVRHEDGALHGELTGIADAVAADLLLVPADDGGLYAVVGFVAVAEVARRVGRSRLAPGRRVAYRAALAAAAAGAACWWLGSRCC